MTYQNYAQDARTKKEKYQDDVKHWLQAEQIIIERLKQHFWVEQDKKKDQDDNWTRYKEDCVIWYWDKSWKIEIKYTAAHLTWIQWKENQWEHAVEDNIYLLQISDNRIAFIDPNSKHTRFKNGYCNKPTRSFKVKKWFDSFEEFKEFIINM